MRADCPPVPTRSSTRPPLLLRARAAWARLLLATFGVRCNPRSARRLALAAAADLPSAGSSWSFAEHRPGPDLEGGRLARERLSAAGAEAALRVGMAPRRRARLARLRASLPALELRAQITSETAERLEATLPASSLPESPGLGVRCTLAVALLAEGWLTYSALGIVLPENPAALFLSALVAAPLAAVLLDRSGALARRCVWRGHAPPFHDIALMLLLVACPAALAVGITLSRVVGVSVGRDAAIWVSAGLQATILAVPFISGYLGADPVPGLRAAQRRRDRAVTALARVQQTGVQLETEQAHAVQACAQAQATACCAFDYWLSVYASRSAIDSTASAVSPTRASGKSLLPAPVQ